MGSASLHPPYIFCIGYVIYFEFPYCIYPKNKIGMTFTVSRS
ncbi:Uncharacterized protein dnm_091140 [Desulfonema magnum]|uniref:Uncharacterized protein n=1 Tax=Desulfonema magnum TaxID=45655 RepID=A0A975BWH5_9BACT|nr:Uncharacterized protein dnm_091140 [Desulfonema magnum]